MWRFAEQKTRVELIVRRNTLGLLAALLAFPTYYIFATAQTPLATISVPGCNPSALSAEALAQLFTNQEVPVNCVQSTPRVELSAPVNNDINVTAKFDYTLGGDTLIKAVRARLSLNSSPPVGVCTAFQDSSLVAGIFSSILGRAATSSELSNLMACLVAGKLSPIDLEKKDNFCLGMPLPAPPSLLGLRGHTDYKQDSEIINSIFSIYLNRLPAIADASNVSNYRVRLKSSIITTKMVKNMIDKFKIDYKNSISNPPVLNDLVIRKMFDYLYRGRALSSFQTAQLRTHLTKVANGDVIIYNIANTVRTSTNYIESMGLPATSTTSLADEAEAFSFSFRALLGRPPDVNTEKEYAGLLQLGKTDIVLSPLEWAIANLKSQSDYETAGGCPIAPPRPQITISVVTPRSNLPLYNYESCLCAAKRIPKGAGLTIIKGVNLTTTHGGGSCEGVSCSTGNLAYRVQVPKPPSIVMVNAITFGVRTQSQFISQLQTATESSTTLSQLSYRFPTLQFADTPPGGMSISGFVEGPGGRSVTSSQPIVVVKKPAVSIITESSLSYGFGPPEPLGELTSIEVTSPPATIAIVNIASEDNRTTETELVTKVFLDSQLTRTNSKLYDVSFGRYILCTYNGVAFGGSHWFGSTCEPRYYINNFVNPPISNIGFYSNYFTMSPTPTPTKLTQSSLLSTSSPAFIYSYTDFDRTKDFTLPIGGENRVLRTRAGVWGDTWTQYYSSRYSPLVIDLENKGIETLPPSEAVLFDLKGIGKKDLFSWVKNGEEAPFLALDRNGNGQIDDVHELFGDQTKGPDGKKSNNGFDSLKKYDLNQDGVIDASDEIYFKLVLWYDRNHNAISEPDEMADLASAEIMALDLKYIDFVEPNDRFGNESNEKSVVLMNDGSFRTVFDIWFVAGNSQKN